MRKEYMNELTKKYGLPSTECLFNPDVYWDTLTEHERNMLHHFQSQMHTGV